jgi:hypothetical protein
MRLLNVHDFKLESGVPDPGLSGPEAKLWSHRLRRPVQYPNMLFYHIAG